MCHTFVFYFRSVISFNINSNPIILNPEIAPKRECETSWLKVKKKQSQDLNPGFLFFVFFFFVCFVLFLITPTSGCFSFYHDSFNFFFSLKHLL